MQVYLRQLLTEIAAQPCIEAMALRLQQERLAAGGRTVQPKGILITQKFQAT